MNLTINGENQIATAETLGALVAHLGMKPDRVAIELNREIVRALDLPRALFAIFDRLLERLGHESVDAAKQRRVNPAGSACSSMAR